MKSVQLKSGMTVQLSWNDAKDSEWSKIEDNFVAAYLSSYKDSERDKLGLPDSKIQEAETLFLSAYLDARKRNVSVFDASPELKKLEQYFCSVSKERPSCLPEKTPIVEQVFTNDEILKSGQEIVKLLAISLSFREDFEGEKFKIHSQTNKINWLYQNKIQYVLARLEDSVVGFVVCQFNPKTARAYLRWVTLAPNFHGRGLGKFMLEAVEKHFQEAIGIELYTRTENQAARGFYGKVGFQETLRIESKPVFHKELNQHQDICVYPVSDDLPDPSHIEAYVGCVKKISQKA